MKEVRRSIAVLILSAGAIVALLVCTGPVSVQAGHENDNDQGENDNNQHPGKPPKRHPTPQPAVYNPYPPGILPSDLNSEIARVLREVDFIEARALARWHNLSPPTLTGQPPTLQNTGYETVQTLGKLMNYDKNISPGKNQACASCHMPYVAFSGPIPSVNLTMIAYPGTFHFRTGKRTAQRYTYSPRYPVLQLYPDQGLLFGGNFWDGRSTGYLLQSADAEHICATPGGAAIFGTDTTPVTLKPKDRLRANEAYNHWAQSISFFEDGPEVSPFTSKVDANINGLPGSTYSPDEIAGMNLFRGKANCNS